MESVLDCSVALAWALPDEGSSRAEKFLAGLSPDSALWVPALWWYETSNALVTAERRHRLQEGESRRII
jgi:predicted nucleic acid-binding protein